MGGMPTVGYELKDRKLVVKSEQAEVCQAHLLVATRRSVARLTGELRADGYST
jgi:hypothetical protein